MSNSLVKKTATVVVGAALFGGISGGVFNLVVGDRTYDSTEKTSEASTEASEQDVISSDADATTEKDKSTEDNAPVVNIPQSEGIINTGNGMNVTEIVDETMPSVVAITIKSVQEYSDWWFGQSYQYETQGSGSGIIIGENSTELLIVTNNHVVEGANSVTVGFIDGEAYEAKVKGTNSENDVAVIEVNLAELKQETVDKIKIAKIGDSDSVLVGEQVVAIGNALGYGQSVTTGIVSAKDRMNSTNETPLIQTDAAINPGNSGGALINMKGEIIGINSSKYSDTSVEGMGYAIPIKAVEEIINNLSEKEVREKVDEEKRGFLGVEVTTIDSTSSEYYNIPVGAYVSNVVPDSAAEKAGIKQRMVIVKFDGESISSKEKLFDTLEYYAEGEEVVVGCKVLEDDEYVDKDFTVKLSKRADFVDEDSNEKSDNKQDSKPDDNSKDKDNEEVPEDFDDLEDFFNKFGF